MISALSLTTGQRCPRRYKLETEYKVLRERPRAVLDRLLRAAILNISNGADAAHEAEEASTRLLEQAARPGLDIPTDPYTLCRDFCALIHNVCEAVSRLTLLTLTLPPIVPNWTLSSPVDESGLLHRWLTCERWDLDTQYRELHSWAVFGDCAALATGMWLHIIEIGRQSKGHQHTPWCRAYKHPAIHNHYRFRSVEGGPLQGDWKPVWFQDSKYNEPKGWVDLMEADKLELITHVLVREPGPEHVAQFHRELAVESARLGSLPTWQDIPMFRPACDSPPCPWDMVCYGKPGTPVEAAGGYVKINS
jgi:hypothetical protein